MAHSGHHHRHNHAHGAAEAGDRKVAWAVAVNVLLTVAQIVGGVFAGSLALIADAIHNLSDAVALGLAYAARRVARRPADHEMTFGYGRAEIVAALANYTALLLIAAYLAYEAIWRLVEPEPVDGWIVVIVAGIALAVDVATMLLTFRLAKESMNIRAAFLHNLADALGSLGVIIAGTLVILYDWYVADALITLAIAGYIAWHVLREIGGVVRILMLATPPSLSPAAILDALREIDGVAGVHHLHVWRLDENRISLEAHIVVNDADLGRMAEIKRSIKDLLKARFDVAHSTLEFESKSENCLDSEEVGHRH